MIFSKRAWGWWLVLLAGKEFKVKLLWFKNGGACSYQKHNLRKELWLFLMGKGVFVSQFNTEQVESGACKHVDLFEWHKYIAINRTLILEIQTGQCMEEDIVRG